MPSQRASLGSGGSGARCCALGGALARTRLGDATFSEGNRPLFAFASYNCGTGNVAKARKETERRGLDPNKWFNKVEIVISEKIGVETTTYVRNIYKYYVAYKLTLEAQAEAEKARQQVAPAKS